MAGYSQAGSMAPVFIRDKLRDRKVVLFVKKRYPGCHRAMNILNMFHLPNNDYEVVDYLRRQDAQQLDLTLWGLSLMDTMEVGGHYTCNMNVGRVKLLPLPPPPPQTLAYLPGMSWRLLCRCPSCTSVANSWAESTPLREFSRQVN